MTNSFKQITSTGGEYLWSTVANWTNGAVPGNGAAVTFNVSGSNNPSGYDDIASLALDSLDVVNGFAAVGASLSVGTVSFGSTVASVFSDTDLGSAAATVTIDGFSGATDGRVGAFGTNAVTDVLSATDPGEIYQVDEGGELVLSATPHGNPGPTNAGFYYQNSHGTGELPSGTFAFDNPGATVSSLLSNVAVGDSIALPGSDVASVTYTANSLSVVTNLGTTTFSDVTYLAGSSPAGYTVSSDPTGLERITFDTLQDIAFQQITPTGGEYLWSTVANWTNGAVPGNGAAVTFNVSGSNNPSGYDDITSLALDSLDVINGFAAVGASLSIGTVSFGSTVASVFSDTDLGSAAATLTIDGFSGATDGRVGAFGVNAVTFVLGTTDPGEICQVDEGGDLVLSATPHGNPGPTNAGFYYQNSHGTGELPSGTFAFDNPGATVSSLLSNVAVGDSIALPGSDVVSVTYGANSLTAITNLGTTTFSDVTYLAGAEPTGFTESSDPEGLERITFAALTNTSFQQITSTGGEYLWSTVANWTNGAVPGNGTAVTFNVSGSNNPSGYDDVASLALDSLDVVNGFAAVGASLSVGTVSFGSTVASVFSDTDLGSAAATVTIDGFSGATDGRVGAFGTNAVTDVLSATDPGEIYQVDEGGELVLSATPHGNPGPTNAGFYYQNSHGTGELPSGTFAFDNPGATVSSLLSNVAVGDSIALPGSDVASVTFGTGSLIVATDRGRTTFSDVTYLAGAKPTGFTVSTDPAGLERITFAALTNTSFQQIAQAGDEYLWSNATNWTNGVPVNGAAVTFNVTGSNNPSGYDDISNLTLDGLVVTAGFAAVGASLSLGTVTFGSTVSSVFSDTDLGSTSASLTIDGFNGRTDGRVGAFGSNAVTDVLSTTDPGEIYQVDEGGELVLSATPHGSPGPTNAGFYYQNSHGTNELPSGTFAFNSPGGTVSSLLSNVAVGDSIALPGSDVGSVTYGGSSLSIVTNLGTTTFSDVTYLTGAEPTGFTESNDPTGLERVTFASVACFLRGTQIMTRRGDVPVEALTAQDEVLTQSGLYRPVRWTGRRAIDADRHPDPDVVLPIRVARDAVAPCVPACDVHLSPDHAIWIGGVLIPIRMLINGATIARDRSVLRPVYYHVELNQHDILFANGMPAESYLDTGNRAMFENGGAPLALHPDFGTTDGQARREAESCVRLVCDGEGVKPIWHALARRAEVLGFALPVVETTDGALPGILAGGRFYRPVAIANERYTFLIPALSGEGRLISRAVVPSDVTPWEDRRRLGLMVRGITVRCGDRQTEIAMDDPKLFDGWWAIERDSAAIWRWSNGDANLPVTGERVVIEVWVGGTLRYPVANQIAEPTAPGRATPHRTVLTSN